MPTQGVCMTDKPLCKRCHHPAAWHRHDDEHYLKAPAAMLVTGHPQRATRSTTCSISLPRL